MKKFDLLVVAGSNQFLDNFEGESSKFSGKIYPDLALGLIWNRSPDAPAKPKPLVGISPMPVYDYRYWCVRDDDKYRTYVIKLARFTERLIDTGYPVHFFGTMWRDDNVVEDVLAALDNQKVDDSQRLKLVRQCEDAMFLLKSTA